MKIEGYDLEEMPLVEAVRVGFVSLVGIGGDNKYPLDWGNYFSLDTADGKTYEIANMWYENLKHLIDEDKIHFPITIKIIDDTSFGIKDGWAIVYDDRVPRNFYTDTSYRAPKKFWSLTKQANRQLDIDSGRLKIITTDSGINFESYHCEGSTVLVSAPYVPKYVNEDTSVGSVKIRETVVDPKYYTTIIKSSDDDEESN